MTVAKEYTNLVPEGYLPEKMNTSQLEYSQREICKMAEANRIHDTICVNALSVLKTHIRNIGYHIHTGNVKLSIDQEGNIFYSPDITISSEKWDRNEEYLKNYPYLIVEVTSDRTEASDRGEKFADYRKLASLQEYVLISQERVCVECFRRDAKGNWVYCPYSQGEEVYLASINFQIPIAAFYEDVPLSRNANFYFSKEKQERKHNQLSASRLMFPAETETPAAPKSELPPNNSSGNQSLKLNILVSCLIGLSIATIGSFGINQMYDFGQTKALKKVAAPTVDRNRPIVPTPPAISQNNLNQQPQLTKREELEARKMISLIDRMQKGFYSENQRFAGNWEDLGFNVQSNKQDYEYKIVSSDERKTIITANAKNPGLKSYTGIVVVEDESAIDQICETTNPLNTAPEVTEISNKNIQCPAGSISVLGQ